MQLQWNEWDENYKLEMDKETEWMSITELDMWNGYHCMELEWTEQMNITELEWIYGTNIWNECMEQVYMERMVYGTGSIWNRYTEQIYGAGIWNGYVEQRYMEQI